MLMNRQARSDYRKGKHEIRQQYDHMREDILAIRSDKIRQRLENASKRIVELQEQREVLTGYVEMGYLDDAEVDLDGAEIKIEGDKASVTGVGLETAMGAVELEFELQKEKGAWLITGFEYY